MGLARRLGSGRRFHPQMGFGRLVGTLRTDREDTEDR